MNFTARLLSDAGIRAGMNVLDIGCGAGEVSCLLAETVQDTGAVVGVDINRDALARAEALAKERQLKNITFTHASLLDLPFSDGKFDAVVGRRILMYLQSAAETMHRISRFVKPGGLYVFQESDSTFGAKGTISMPLHDKVMQWIWKTVEKEGADIHLGFMLSMKMREAGICVDHIRAEPAIQGQAGHNSLPLIIQAMQPRIIEQGVASEEEVDIKTLEERLAAEYVDGAIYISDMSFGAWGHKL